MHTVTRFLLFFILGISLVHASPASWKQEGDGVHQHLRTLVTRTRPASEDSTNAYRLAHGLNPRAPKVLYSPTRVRRDSPSTSPTLTGNVVVYQAGTSIVRGYLNPAASTPSVVANPPSTLFTYVPPVTSGSPVEMNYNGQSLRLAVGSSSGIPGLLGPSSANSARFLSTNASTPTGSTPQRESTSSARYLETSDFVIDPATGGISVSWVNYDGSRPSVSVAQQGAYLYITGSASRFLAIAPGALQVDLRFVPT